MMLLALALAQATAPEGDVVVIGRKLAQWSGRITSNPLWTRCKTTRSTGDREIDAIGCTAMERCWPDVRTRIKAANAKGVVADDRKQRIAAAERDFGTCSKRERNGLIDALAERRAGRGAHG